MATTSRPWLRSAFSTGFTSPSSIATSPATAAFSSLPTKAAHDEQLRHLVSFHFFFSSSPSVEITSLARNRQVIERDDAVCLGPQSDLSAGIGLVLCVDQRLAVVMADDVLSLGDHPQSVPFVGRHLDICPCELQPAAVHHPVKPEVVLKRIGPDHVITLGVAETKDHANALIDLS